MGKGDGSRRVLRRIKQVKKGPSSQTQTQMHTARKNRGGTRVKYVETKLPTMVG